MPLFPPYLSRQRGFTLLEILIATALFSIVIVSFITILVSVTRVQVQQASAAEVNQQSQFLLQQMQYYVARASVIDMVADTASSTLRLRMSASSSDPTVITIAGGVVYLQQGPGGALQPLTSGKVSVSSLTFTKRSNPPAHDTVDISFAVAYNTSSLQQAFSEIFQTSVARVSAASFDSNLVPSSSATYSLGVSGQTWTSVNNILNFSGSNVGIGTASPQQTLEVNGGMRLNNSGGLPTCNSNARGTLWFLEQAPGTRDSLQLCYENTSSAYVWATLF